MSEPARVSEFTDVSPRPTTPEAQEWLDEVYSDAADGTLWAVPSIREQLSEHYNRPGRPD